MNKTSFIVSAALLPLALASCNMNQKSENVIQQPSVEIIDGQMTPEILQAFGIVQNPTLSPDGKKIAFTVSFENIQSNSSNADIYIMNTDGTEMKQLTNSDTSEHNLQWIEDGAKLAFLAKDPETEKVQVFTINPDGSNRKRASLVETGVECFSISPDGSKILYGSAITTYNQKDSVLFKGLDKTSGRVVDDLMYKHWDEWVDAIPHPFLADFTGNNVSESVDIMEGEPYECPMRPFGGAESFAWAPDSKSFVYVCRKLTGMEYSKSTDSNLYLYDIASKKTTKLTGEDFPGYDTDPVFSPDGNSLAWLSMKTPGYESDKKRLMLMDMKTRQTKDLTADWDYWPEGLAWAPDGKSIVFNGYQGGTEPVFRMDVATCKVDTLAAEMWDYNSVSQGPDGNVYAIRRNMTRPYELCKISQGDVTMLTDVNKNLLDRLAPITVNKEIIPTTDGKEMTAWVVLPPNFDPNKKYPALLYCQGGPQQAVSQYWSNRWNFRLMASNGYIIIAPNRRGVPGFGEEWNLQISGDYGGQNMKDYLSAVDYMKEKPYVDGEHIGAIGASYGGFSVYWLAGHHEGRFAALVAHAGIFNLEAQYLETEELWFANFDMGGAYWEKENATAQATYATSPHKFVDKWTAPILVTVGELDYRILASQGMMAFNAAKLHGLECEMLVFPDENHWVLQPQNAILWQRVFFRFLDKYLKTEDNTHSTKK